MKTTEQTALILMEFIQETFMDRELIKVTQGCKGKIEVRQNQKIKAIHVINDRIVIRDTSEIATSGNWKLSPEQRSIEAKTTTGGGENFKYIWAIAGLDKDGAIADKIAKANKRLGGKT